MREFILSAMRRANRMNEEQLRSLLYSFGEEYALKKGLKLSIFKADWKKYGRAAGPIRNREMYHYALEDKPMIIAFWDGVSKGTSKGASKQGRESDSLHIEKVKYFTE